jgi:hypothetical protein
MKDSGIQDRQIDNGIFLGEDNVLRYTGTLETKKKEYFLIRF